MPQSLRRKTSNHRLFICLALAALYLAMAAKSVFAHELRPAVAQMTIAPSGALELRVDLNLEAWLAEVSPDHQDTANSKNADLYNDLRGSLPADLRVAALTEAKELAAGLQLRADGRSLPIVLEDVQVSAIGDLALARTSRLTFAGRLPTDSRALTWLAEPRYGDMALRLKREGDAKPFYAALLQGGEESRSIPLEGLVTASFFASLADYSVIGFEHILPKGLDHILFIVGLFLLSPYLRPLLWQVSGFTLAHSVTLALGIYGVLAIPPQIVEPLIALSIVYIAVENLFTDRLRRWRPFVVVAFGLLHGLGFAGVLAEVGLPQDQFVAALLGFNLGVELGQIAVLAFCFLTVGLWFRSRHWYRPALSMPASIAVALVAAYWFAERLA